jgi:cobalt-zinc-cadmium efflux system protein
VTDERKPPNEPDPDGSGGAAFKAVGGGRREKHEHVDGHEHEHVHVNGHGAARGHHHGHHHHGHQHHGAASKNLLVALLLNLGFAILEIFGGLWTGSVAILTDAVHDFGDAMALGLALVFEKRANKRPDLRYSYGYRRLSLLSATLTSVFLIVGSCLVLTQAIPRLLNPVTPRLNGMLAFAALGIAVNGFAAWRLMRGRTMNERVASWHLMEDVLGWVSVAIGALVMRFFDLPIIDPLLSVVFSLFIFWNVGRNLHATVKLFLQATPDDVDLPAFRREVEALPGVRGTHDAHLWSLDGESHVLTIHVVVDEAATVHQLQGLKTSIRALATKRGKIHVTVETEAADVNCPDVDCGQEAR